MEKEDLSSHISADKKKIWITWENHRRSTVLSEEFKAKLFVMQCNNSNRLIRYLVLSAKTLHLMVNEKAQYVFCQNPSIFLALLLCTFKTIFGYKLIVDRHSNFVIDTDNNAIVKTHDLISDYTIKMADYTIVTNDYLRNFVASKRGRGLVLQDKLPLLDLADKVPLDGRFNVAFITSFNFDEPISEVITAFKNIDTDIHLYITGNYKNHPLGKKYSAHKPHNIHFTGYLSEKDYQDLLYSSDALIVLTKFDYILTCGAYEGIALGKPLILSNTQTIKEYFRSGAVYCESEPESIRNAIQNCITNLRLLEKQIVEFRKANTAEWEQTFSNVLTAVYG